MPKFPPSGKRRLLVGGLHASGSGYPNAPQTLDVLRRYLDVEVVNCGAWLPDSYHLWRLTKERRSRLLFGLATLAFGNLASLMRVLWKQWALPTPVYVPYPAVFFLWWASWLPFEIRPKIVADAYISLWDSFARDRAAGLKPGLVARLLKSLERRALRAASYVLVDTEANREMYIREFGLNPERVRSLPLAIDETLFIDAKQRRTDQTSQVTVLFIGTMIPLHGIEYILESILQLRDEPMVRFRIVGDGQLGECVARVVASLPAGRVEWIRDWRRLDQIADDIAEADICLGIFGGTSKAARVFPFKIYMYFACGKPVISQGDFSLPAGCGVPPLVTVPPASATALADEIRSLIRDPAKRRALALASKQYYSDTLSNRVVAKCWQEWLWNLR